MHKIISGILGHKKYVPLFIKHEFFDNTPVIVSEFIDESLEEVLEKKPKLSLGIKQMMLQMFDCIVAMH